MEKNGEEIQMRHKNEVLDAPPVTPVVTSALLCSVATNVEFADIDSDGDDDDEYVLTSFQCNSHNGKPEPSVVQ